MSVRVRARVRKQWHWNWYMPFDTVSQVQAKGTDCWRLASLLVLSSNALVPLSKPSLILFKNWQSYQPTLAMSHLS